MRENDLDFYISHFSEWWIVAIFKKLRNKSDGKRLICTPYIPKETRLGKLHEMHLYLHDDLPGLDKVSLDKK